MKVSTKNRYLLIYLSHVFILELGQIPQQVQARPSVASSTGVQPRWIPRPEGFAKINVDVGVSVDHNLGSAAAICRDRDGTFLGSSVLVIQGLVDPPSLEALACRDVLALAQDLGINYVHIASDCKQVVNHILDKVGGNYAGIIQEISKTSRLFSICNFCHEFRASNIEAHTVASMASPSLRVDICS